MHVFGYISMSLGIYLCHWVYIYVTGYIYLCHWVYIYVTVCCLLVFQHVFGYILGMETGSEIGIRLTVSSIRILFGYPYQSVNGLG